MREPERKVKQIQTKGLSALLWEVEHAPVLRTIDQSDAVLQFLQPRSLFSANTFSTCECFRTDSFFIFAIRKCSSSVCRAQYVLIHRTQHDGFLTSSCSCTRRIRKKEKKNETESENRIECALCAIYVHLRERATIHAIKPFQNGKRVK